MEINFKIVFASLIIAVGGCAPEISNKTSAGKNSGIIGAGSTYQSAMDKASVDNVDKFGQKSGPIINSGNYEFILQFNNYLVHEFLGASDQARAQGKFANGLLILTSVAYGIGTVNGVNADALKRGLIAGLGLSEGLRYLGPNPSSLAFLTAAEQSACIAARGAGASSPTGADAAVLWETMVQVQTELRRNLTRKPVGLIVLATSFVSPLDHNSEGYELIRSKQRLSAVAKRNAMSTSEKTGLRYKLLGCMAQETSSDN